MTDPKRTESPGYSNFVLAALFVVYIFNFVDRQILAILIQPIKEDLGVSDTMMGLLTGPIFVISYTLAGLPLARWADRHSDSTRSITSPGRESCAGCERPKRVGVFKSRMKIV